MFMKKYFGDLGETLLKKNLEALQIKDLNKSSEEDRVNLIQQLVGECFSTIMSMQRAKVITTKLISLLRVRSSAYSRLLGKTGFDNTAVRF